MPRKRFSFMALLVVAALAVAGVAVAAKKPTTSASATSATATFNATTVSKAHNTTCTAKSGDAFQSTTATYKGTASSSDARLNGPITIKAHSFVDTTSGLGKIKGVFTIKGTTTASVNGVLTGVISNGSLSGLVTGTAKGPNGQLLASLGGNFGQTSGFALGSLGSPTTGGGAVISNGYCPTKAGK